MLLVLGVTLGSDICDKKSHIEPKYIKIMIKLQGWLIQF